MCVTLFCVTLGSLDIVANMDKYIQKKRISEDSTRIEVYNENEKEVNEDKRSNPDNPWPYIDQYFEFVGP